jgi:hypothetical protein
VKLEDLAVARPEQRSRLARGIERELQELGVWRRIEVRSFADALQGAEPVIPLRDISVRLLRISAAIRELRALAWELFDNGFPEERPA